MTNILELLKNEKVEWKKLGEVCEIIRGVRITKKELLTEGYPVVSGGTGYMGYIDKYNREAETITIAQYGTAGYVNFQKERFWANDVCFSVIPYKNVLNKYLYYFLIEKQDYLYEISNRIATPYSISKDKILSIEIPIPSLEIQEKIVKILDEFTNYVTELQLELQSELQSRTKQYIYYRDKLLSEEYLNKVTKEMEEDRRLDIVQLEEVVTIKNGKDWKKLGQGDIPVYGSGGEMGVFVDKYSYDKPTVLIPRKGSIDNVFYLDKPFWNVDTIFHTEIDESKLIPKYFYYFIEHYDLNKLSDNSTRPSLTQSTLNKLKLPLPPLSLQNKVVKVLDKFQVLLSDTKGLIPEEIEQRQKQYEYYREKLLTFDVECSRTNERTFIISNIYYDILQEAANIVEVDINNQVIIKMLGELGDFTNGSGMPKTIFDEKGDVGAIHYGHIYTKYNLFVYTPIIKVRKENSIKLKKVNYGDIVIAKTSENIDDIMKSVAYLGKEEVVVGGHAAVYRHKQNPKYLSYVFNGYNDLLKQKNRLARGVKVIEISSIDMEKIKIPVPPLHVQQHVVSILDKFDTLVNDIKEGLPKEIEQRQKQYEYWRECLLNFPR